MLGAATLASFVAVILIVQLIRRWLRRRGYVRLPGKFAVICRKTTQNKHDKHAFGFSHR